MSNPHSPTKSWLDGVATDRNGYDIDAEPGDEGSITRERDGTEYEVTVTCTDEYERVDLKCTECTGTYTARRDELEDEPGCPACGSELTQA